MSDLSASRAGVLAAVYQAEHQEGEEDRGDDPDSGHCDCHLLTD